MVAAITAHSKAHVMPTTTRRWSVLVLVRFNSGRFPAWGFCIDIKNSLRDTRPEFGFHYAWQVFWLVVIGLDVFAFPGKSQWLL